MSGLTRGQTHEKRLPDRTYHCDWMMFLHDNRAHGRRNSHDSQTAVDSSFGSKIAPSGDPSCNCLPSLLLCRSHNSWHVLQNQTKHQVTGRPTAHFALLCWVTFKENTQPLNLTRQKGKTKPQRSQTLQYSSNLGMSTT